MKVKSKIKRKKSKVVTQKVGQIPGSLTYTGIKKDEGKAIRLVQYNEENIFFDNEFVCQDIIDNLDHKKVNWIHFYNLNQVEAIEKIGQHFDIHSLMLEDILNVEHLPKVEFSENHVFFTLKILSFDHEHQLEQEHVSFILGDTYILSFKEQRGELFKPIRERIKRNIGKVRRKRADYLFYMLVDAIVDNYLLMLESLSKRIEDLEDELIENPNKNNIAEIHIIKKQLFQIRKQIFVLCDAVSNLIKEEPQQIFESNYKYIKDIQDHVNFVFESIETFLEDQKSLMELNNSNMNNKMNQVMKTLTVVATIFIPLTFVAGIYGMNFQFMPELGWKWGYFSVLGFMSLIVITMIWFMKRKRWL